MDQNSNFLTFEINVKLAMKDYRVALGLKHTWIAIAVGLVQGAVWLFRQYH